MDTKMFRRQSDPTGFTGSQLLDQSTFYPLFLRDLNNCKSEVIIESPFITSRRINTLLPTISMLRSRGVRVVINTRHPSEHDELYCPQACDAIERLQNLGVIVLFTGGHHRKLAILDRQVLFEGSLNILSFSNSCEIMRKITSKVLAEQMIDFLRLEQFLTRNEL